MNIEEFIKVLKSEISAWYLDAGDDYSTCDTCGPDDDTKPDCDTVFNIIDKTFEYLVKK